MLTTETEVKVMYDGQEYDGIVKGSVLRTRKYRIFFLVR